MTKAQNRGWSSQVPPSLTQQDALLQSLVLKEPSQTRIRWVSLARQLSALHTRERSGKQCRERWQHQLNPKISKAGWTQEQTQKLFDLQRQFGNKWSQISQALPGRTDNITKNFFYAFVRKNITKINMALRLVPKTSPLRLIRSFDSEFTSKLILVSDGHFQDKIRLNSLDLRESAREILNEVIGLDDVGRKGEGWGQELQGLVERMQNFRLNSKKKKQSKKGKDHQRFLREELQLIPTPQLQIIKGKTHRGSDGDGKVRGPSRRREGVYGGARLSHQDALKEEIQQQLLSEQAEIDAERSDQPTVDSIGSIPTSPTETRKELSQQDQPLLEPYPWTTRHHSYTRLWDSLKEQLVFGPAVEEEWSFGEESSLHMSFLGLPEQGDILGGRFGRVDAGFESGMRDGEYGEDFPL